MYFVNAGKYLNQAFCSKWKKNKSRPTSRNACFSSFEMCVHHLSYKAEYTSQVLSLKQTLMLFCSAKSFHTILSKPRFNKATDPMLPTANKPCNACPLPSNAWSPFEFTDRSPRQWNLRIACKGCRSGKCRFMLTQSGSILRCVRRRCS